MAANVSSGHVSAEAAEALRAALVGEVLAPGEHGYEEGRRVWNGMIDRRPALIARCAGVADVVEAVLFARTHGLAITVRGGGHGVAGGAVGEGALMIDLSLMKDISINPAASTARAGGGCTLGDLDRATQAHGLAAPLGVVTATGIAGLTLSGGMGWLRRKHGLSCDNLVSVDLVTADGRTLTASEAENADLFWGLRGGGGSFGIVTSFEYRLHPVGPEVMFCFILYPGDRAAEILRFCDEYTDAAPVEVSPVVVLGHVPVADVFPTDRHGEPFAALVAMYPGDAAEGEKVLAPLRELGDPIVDLSGRMSYCEAQSILDEDYPIGRNYYWKSIGFDDLAAVVEQMPACNAASPSHHSTIDVWFNNGMEQADPTATAFGSRPRYLVTMEANWDEDDESDANVDWARTAWASLHPDSTGASYLNFPGFHEEGQDLLRASYGEDNYARLAALKAAYDPGNVLRADGHLRPLPG